MNDKSTHSQASPSEASVFEPFPKPQTYPQQWDAAALQAPCRPSTYGWKSKDKRQS
ncbi:MAG: hypothetical protein HY866_12110 [Chloroflexi bacterium]|nr:hypothetical protein [Chloroflexota bacterium]